MPSAAARPRLVVESTQASPSGPTSPSGTVVSPLATATVVTASAPRSAS